MDDLSKAMKPDEFRELKDKKNCDNFSPFVAAHTLESKVLEGKNQGLNEKKLPF